MNYNTIKAGRLRRLFACAGIGLILLGAGCAQKTQEEAKPEVVSVPADEMISIPWNAGWTPAVNVAFGIPFELHGSDEIVYEISGDTSYLCLIQEGKPESMGDTGTTRKAEETLYWNPSFANAQKYLDGIGTSWITIVRKQEGYPTGLVLVKISQLPETMDNVDASPVHSAEIIASLAFPLQDGAYQDVTDEDLKEIEAAYIN